MISKNELQLHFGFVLYKYIFPVESISNQIVIRRVLLPSVLIVLHID